MQSYTPTYCRLKKEALTDLGSLQKRNLNFCVRGTPPRLGEEKGEVEERGPRLLSTLNPTQQTSVCSSFLGSERFCLFVLLFYNCIIKGISPMGNSSCFSEGKPAASKSRYSIYGACWVLYYFHNPPNCDMDYRIFNECTDANA